MEIILAIDKKYGIGKNGIVPWYFSDDLKLFKNLTLNSNILIGRKTAESLPFLKDRKIYVLSDTIDNKEIDIGKNHCIVIKETNITKIPLPIFIAGGAEIYNYFFREILLKRINIKSIHLTYIDIDYYCDKFIDKEKFFEIIQNYATQKVEKNLCENVVYYRFDIQQ